MGIIRDAFAGRKVGGRLRLLLLLPALVLFAGCDLAITKGDSPDPVNVGEPLTYTLNVTNTPADPPPPEGQGGWPQVLVTDTLPQSVEFVSVTPSQGTCAPPADAGVVQCNLGPLGLNQSATIEIVVVPQVAGEIQNTASVQGSGSLPPLQTPPSVTQAQYEDETCDNQIECDPQGNNTVTITTLVIQPAGPVPTPPDTPTPPGDQYEPGDQPGVDADDAPEDEVPVGGGTAFPAGSSCVNLVSDIDIVSGNSSGQAAGDDAAIQSGPGSARTISQDEAQTIAQENGTTIGVVQQCAQDAGVNVLGADGTGATGVVAPSAGAGSAVSGASAGLPNAVDTLDSNGDGVIGEAEARAVLGEEAATAMAEADTDGDGGVSVSEAEAFASGYASASEAPNASGAGVVEVLPDTGGASLLVLAAGALLVAGGLAARRIVT